VDIGQPSTDDLCLDCVDKREVRTSNTVFDAVETVGFRKIGLSAQLSHNIVDFMKFLLDLDLLNPPIGANAVKFDDLYSPVINGEGVLALSRLHSLFK
jgi:hypothetical protein